MFFIKTQGTDKVPDYVQIRDKNFALLEIVKISFLEKKIIELFPENADEIVKTIQNSEAGKVIEIE
jgi:hypothetical protein